MTVAAESGPPLDQHRGDLLYRCFGRRGTRLRDLVRVAGGLIVAADEETHAALRNLVENQRLENQ